MVNKMAYAALVLLRLLVAITSTSTIHPDEHFQNPELAASLLFDYGAGDGGLLKTWEWVGASPIRCITPVASSVGAAFAVVKWVGGEAPSARTLFLAQRAVMWVLSLIIDWTLSRSTSSDLPLLLFATAPITFAFLVRPFSNSLETILYAVALYLVGRIVESRGKDTRMAMGSLGAVLAMGIFTRVTFLAFAVPLVGAIVVSTFLQIRGSAIVSLSVQGLPALLGFVASSLVLAAIDTLYFTSLSIRDLFDLRTLIVTPLNSFRFNLSTSNLAAHGLHPRYLHALVNWPMLVGVGLWAMGDVLLRRVDAGKEKSREAFMRRVYASAIIVPTAILSIQPHQEPRFLIPMIVPLVLLVKDATFFRSGTTSSRKLRKIFWTLWITHSLLFTIFFGYLHQGGLVPALISINQGFRIPGLPFLGSESTVSPSTNLEFVFWQTFMPPRHLILPLPHTTGRSIHVTDLASSSPATLYDTIRSLSSPSSTTIVVSPSWALNALSSDGRTGGSVGSCARPLFEGKTFGIHLDTDRWAELWEGGWEGVGVGVWAVDWGCSLD